MDGPKPKPKAAWAFMAEHMPRCVEWMRQARIKGEGKHLDLCWRRGVMELRPGWFWAYEAGVSVGVPDAAMLADPNMQDALRRFPTMSLVQLRDPAAPPDDVQEEGGEVPPAQRGARPKNAA